jgi:hypothetical protein
MPVAIERLVVQRADLAWAGGRIEGLPLFDGGLTGPEGVEATLGAEIGFTEMHPGAASLKKMPFERQRRESTARALIVALRTDPDGLAPLNAPNFRAPFGPPVLQVAGPGPQFTEGFADAQRRLLGPAVSCAPGPMGAASTLRETARMASQQLERLADPLEGPRWREQLRRLALERLGGPGGTDRMVEAIMARLQPLNGPADASPSR